MRQLRENGLCPSLLQRARYDKNATHGVHLAFGYFFHSGSAGTGQ